MINLYEVTETNKMIEEENLDVRTITLGISLLDCIDSDLNRLNEKIYNKIYEASKDLVKTGEEISREFGIPIVNKRISVTPIALIGGAACHTIEDFASIAKTLDKVAHEVGVNFLGGYSALVSKGMTPADPVPLVHIDGVEVVQLLVPADGVHVAVQALAHAEAVVLQGLALPLCQ